MSYELILRLGVFLGLFTLFALSERYAPRRPLTARVASRWLTNWAFVLLDMITLRLMAVILPLLAVGAALDAGQRRLGFFNQIDLPGWVESLLAILLLDLAIWAQHLITHKVPLFWRFHRVHHADADMDVTTAIRFHPVEIAASMLLKIGLVYLLGPSALAVILFEILLNGTALFNHANIALPARADRIVRTFLVTPDMHRVHHSVHRHEHDSNFGFALSLWDRLFRTYRAEPEGGHDGMRVGLNGPDQHPSELGWSLLLPFRK